MQGYKTSNISKDEILSLAKKMKEEEKRLVAIVGYVDKEQKNILSYQYENGNTIEAYTVKDVNQVDSISSIYDLSAAWPEEELYELMGIQFNGLKMRGRLFMPENMVEDDGQILVKPMSELINDNKKVKEE